MSVFVMDYDSNAPNEEWLERTHYPFYKIVREKQPNLPIVFISQPAILQRVHYDLRVNFPWGRLEKRRDIIRASYERAKADGDENIYFLDGKDIFRGDEWDAATVEGCHPNDFGFFRFSRRLGDILEKIFNK
jgi:hypothetical protein